jgi:hypothetical protein
LIGVARIVAADRREQTRIFFLATALHLDVGTREVRRALLIRLCGAVGARSYREHHRREGGEA